MLTRIAPTPSGYLHEGNIYNFMLNWLWARSRGGKVLLRIDDMDASRKRPAYVEDIFSTLEWLGFDWDLGPMGPDNFESAWSQLHRRELYAHSLNYLLDQEKLFACLCTRKQLTAGKPYPGYCADRSFLMHTPHASWRIHVPGHTLIRFDDEIKGPTAIELTACSGSFVVRRSDGEAAYQLSSLIDDRYFGVTHIARGLDLMESTAMQLYLDQALPEPIFHKTTFRHHELIKNKSGDKLSKSAGTQGVSLQQLYSKQQLINRIAKWMGFEEITDLHSMIHFFK